MKDIENTKVEENRKSLSDREKEILAFWEAHAIFQKSVEQREQGPLFSFYDGPPFATGLPHYGHLLAGTIKDAVARYATMKGYYVPRRFGWDCHGVPVEYEVEKTLQLTEPQAIEAFGIAAFNEECRGIVFRYVDEWEEYVRRLGRWVDFSATWKTMDPTFMESVWWVFRSLYDQGLVYEGTKVVPFSTALGTSLSNFEASQNYKDVDDPSVVVQFPLCSGEASLLVWTTTPWTLLSNMAVGVHPHLTYVCVEDKQTSQRYILGQGCVERWFSGKEYEIVDTFLGSELLFKDYVPPFQYFASRREEGAFRTIPATFIEESEGTGLVHMAPAFGEVDFFACKEFEVPLVCPIDQHGLFTQEVPEYQGIHVKQADKAIIRQLKNEGKIFYHGTLVHRYPFCWRTDTPLIYKAVNSWFVSVESIKDKMLRANEHIHWVPGHIKEGRFGKWLEGARDWAISRNRFWGTPLPIWKNSAGDTIVVGSIRELEELTGQTITDLHRHFIDDLVIEKDGQRYHRVPYVFDCWFDSGAMPYAQNHYPFENIEKTEKGFPADFIAEGLDQTRGWFYTLTAISAALFDRPAFKNAIVNGIILAEDGNKMSKRLNNYPSPMHIMNTYGADALRLYLLHSPVVKGEDLRFSDQGVETVLKQVLLPLTNAVHFFITYADLYQFQYRKGVDTQQTYTEMDLWILSNLYTTVQKVQESMEAYDLYASVDPFVAFIDQLTNWYIRRCRRRFWEDEDTEDRRAAFATLYEVLIVFCKVIAPFVPFIAEDIYQKLRGEGDPESVHLCDFPRVESTKIFMQLEKTMADVREIVALGHSLRKEHKIKVRQPLPCFYVIGAKQQLDKVAQFEHLILDELNTKQIIFYREVPPFVSVVMKPNFRVLGKKFGSMLKDIQKAITACTQVEIQEAMSQGRLEVHIGEQRIELALEDLAISWQTEEGYVTRSSNDFTVIFDCKLDEQLRNEGFARELINKINTMRRNLQLHVSDRIQCTIQAPDVIKQAFYAYEAHICKETLITACNFADEEVQGEMWDVNGHQVMIAIQVVS